MIFCYFLAVQSPAANLFQRVPRGLFGPLGDLYAELYWELLANLYQSEFEREPFVVVRPVAVEIAEQMIRNSPLWKTRRQEMELLALEAEPRQTNQHTSSMGSGAGDAEEGSIVRGLARRMITRLEASGWVHFQYRANLGEVMSFHPYAARILETLLKVARDEQPVFQGYIHSIAALLDPKVFAQRPGVSLSEAKRHTLDLVRELKILERNIHLFTERILAEAGSPAKVLEEGFEHYEQAVMANYHRLKTVDNVHRQRSGILERLDAIERDEMSLNAATDWYATQSGSTAAEARIRVKSDLETLRSQLNIIPRIIEEIDARNARFSGVALRKLRYLLRQDRRTEGQLQYIVDALARGDVPEIEFDIYRCELLAGGFLYTPPTARPKLAPQGLNIRKDIDQEKIRREASARIRRPFSRPRIEEFIDQVLAGRAAGSMKEVNVSSDEDYVRLLYIASYGLDRNSSFQLLPSAERVRKGPYTYPEGRIERRAQSRQKFVNKKSNRPGEKNGVS
ncbi:MAG TPA: Wadjet anti-phage system protein JetA family protein [Candidatus Angelobacter sp.]